MGVKFGITIGAVWAGASALAQSQQAVGSLQRSITALQHKKISLKGDARAIRSVNAQLAKLDGAITKINARKLRINNIVEGRKKFKESLLEKAVLVGTVVAPLKIAIDFESAMADVKKVVNFDSNDELKTFQNEIVKLSRTIPLTAKGLAAIVASGGQLGIEKDALLDFTQTTAKMATAFDMLPNQAGDASAKLMNVFGLGVTQVGSLGDAINHLSDNSASKAADVVNVLARIGGSAKVFGLSAKQSASLASAFLALGKSPEVAATATNALLLKLGTADKQGNTFQNALAQIGMSAQQLKDEIAQNGEGAIVAFMERLNQLNDSDKMGVLSDLFGAEYADDIALLSGGIDNYTKSIRLLAREQNYAGSMQREFESRSKTTANNLTILGNSVSAIAINVSSVLLPAFNAMLAPIVTLSNWIGELASRFPTVTGVIAGLGIGAISLSVALSAAAFAGSFFRVGLLRLGNVISFVIGKKAMLSAKTLLVSKMFSLAKIKTLAFSTATKVAAAGQWLFNAALSANPIGLLIVGVAALAAGAVWLYKKFEPFTTLVNSIWHAFKKLFNYITEKWQVVGKLVSGVARVFGFGGDDKSTQQMPKAVTTKPVTPKLTKALGAGILATIPATHQAGVAPIEHQSTHQVTQHIRVNITVNKPSDNIDIEQAVIDAMRKQKSYGDASLHDENI